MPAQILSTDDRGVIETWGCDDLASANILAESFAARFGGAMEVWVYPDGLVVAGRPGAWRPDPELGGRVAVFGTDPVQETAHAA